jgi:hypothetical protein
MRIRRRRIRQQEQQDEARRRMLARDEDYVRFNEFLEVVGNRTWL